MTCDPEQEQEGIKDGWMDVVMKPLAELTVKTIKWNLDPSGLLQTFAAPVCIYVRFHARGHIYHTVGRICVWSHTTESSVLHPRGRDATAAVGRGTLESEMTSAPSGILAESERQKKRKKRQKGIRGSPGGGGDRVCGGEIVGVDVAKMK